MFCTHSLAIFPTHFSQLDLNPANLEAATVSRGKMNSGVSLLAKTAFFNDVTITSSLRSLVQVLLGHFTIFSHTDCQDDSCQKI